MIKYNYLKTFSKKKVLKKMQYELVKLYVK